MILEKAQAAAAAVAFGLLLLAGSHGLQAEKPATAGDTTIRPFRVDVPEADLGWAEQTFHKLIYWNEVDKGGHFAALEQPELFANEIRAAFRSLR